MNIWGAPEIPKGLKGVNLALAFMVSIAFVAAMNLVAPMSHSYSSAINSLPAWMQVTVGVAATCVIGYGLYRLITKAITAAQRAALSASTQAADEGDETEPAVVDNAELIDILRASSSAADHELSRIIEAESSSLQKEFARRYFPATLASLYTRLILGGGGFTIVMIMCNIGNLRSALFGATPNAQLITPLNALVVVPVVLIMVLLLSEVAYRRSRYKEWRVPRWSLFIIRHNMCAVIDEAVARINRILDTLDNMNSAAHGRVLRKYKRVHSEWEPIHDRLLFNILPITGDLIDLPRNLQQLYDRSCKELHAGIRSLAKADVLATPPPTRQIGDTAIADAAQDLTNARERIARIKHLLRTYNLIVRPYVAVP